MMHFVWIPSYVGIPRHDHAQQDQPCGYRSCSTSCKAVTQLAPPSKKTTEDRFIYGSYKTRTKQCYVTQESSLKYVSEHAPFTSERHLL